MQTIRPKTIDDLKSFIASSPETEDFLNDMMKPTAEDVIYSIASAAGSASALSDPGSAVAEIRRLCENHFNSNPAVEAIKSFMEGPDEWDVAAKFEDSKGSGRCASTIDAMGSSDGAFEIEICEVGPLYFIRAAEFDDSDWFTSLKDAVAYAEEEYSEYIAQYEESLYEDDEAEDEDEDEDEAEEGDEDEEGDGEEDKSDGTKHP